MPQIFCPIHGFTPTPGCCADQEEEEKSIWWDFLEEIRKDLEEKAK